MADQIGPYSQDLLTRIYNVQWGSGLAVEFGNKAEDAPEPPPVPLPASVQIKKPQ
jgi:hypothetical protein